MVAAIYPAPRYYSHCQSAATSEVVEAPLSRIVSGAIISEFTFYLFFKTF